MGFRKLKESKLLHVKWIAETYENLKKQEEAAMKGFNTQVWQEWWIHLTRKEYKKKISDH